MDEIAALWKKEIFSVSPADGPALSSYMKKLGSRWSFGPSPQFVVFSIAHDSCFDWFLSRDRLQDVDFFERLLTCDALRKALPDWDVPTALGSNLTHEISWEAVGSLAFDDDLTETLWMTGAEPAVTHPQAQEMAKAVCDELFQRRYEDVVAFKTGASWIGDDPFGDTWVCVDKRERRAWVFFALTSD